MGPLEEQTGLEPHAYAQPFTPVETYHQVLITFNPPQPITGKQLRIDAEDVEVIALAVGRDGPCGQLFVSASFTDGTVGYYPDAMPISDEQRVGATDNWRYVATGKFEDMRKPLPATATHLAELLIASDIGMGGFGGGFIVNNLLFDEAGISEFWTGFRGCKELLT